ncbi:MAG: RICIN domain-containing protein [Lachnospiraceae bacterium]|nr:RICIN domain-containing protein [Lachnospiraceae bacterium]
MKKKQLLRIFCGALCAALMTGGCGKDKAEQENEKITEEEAVPHKKSEDEAGDGNENDNGSPDEVSADKGEDAESVKPEDESYFVSAAAKADQLIQEAKEQYGSGDYTALSEPVAYNVLWLGFTHVTFEDLDFRMTDDDKEYLEAVALNYEKSLESITGHNLDITVDLYFVDDETELTQADGDDWLFLAQETAQPYIDQYVAGKEVDTVLTTVQTEGEENVKRNADKDGFGVNYVMLGLETAGLSSSRGYSTFNLMEPKPGTMPLEDPEIPSLSATAVAVHEWMHQLEYIGTILEIEYPDTHAYMGPEQFPGYQEYTADKNDHDFFEFYKLVLTGRLPYDNGGKTEYVGMYPKMWPLIKGNVYNLGSFTIRAADASGYLCAEEGDISLTLDDDPCIWNIRYTSDGRFTLVPKEYPDKLIDLGNAWDMEGNTIGIWVYTGYADAQSWHLPGNADGSYCIQTPYESGRILTAKKGEQALLCSPGADGVQNWIIEAVKP